MKAYIYLIYVKLLLKNKENLRISKSPFSESIYIIYNYLNSDVKIRFSCHIESDNDNSNIFLLNNRNGFWNKKSINNLGRWGRKYKSNDLFKNHILI